MAFFLTLPLRICQAIFAIIVLGLAGYVSSWWTGYWHGSSPAEINYLIFAAAWSLLALVFLVVVPWKASGRSSVLSMALVAVECLSMIFWFAGFIALAVFLSNRVCFGQVCTIAKTATVFAALDWALFVVTSLMAVMHLLRGGSASRSAPGTKQVEVNPAMT